MSIKNFILSHSNQFNYYKNGFAKLKKENNTLKKENKALEKEKKTLDEELEKIKSWNKYEDGISVIIPTYKGDNHIKTLLESLEKQTLDYEKYEIIFVINGELNPTINILKEFMEKNESMNVIINYTPVTGASNARNIGLRIAKKEYTTFIDDDDFVSPKFLEKLYEYSKPNRVVMTNFIDIDEESGEEIESKLVPSSFTKNGVIENALVELVAISANTTAKSLPTFAAKEVKFNTQLNSGEDISYYCRLYPQHDFEFYFIDKKEGATYYRTIRTESVSRQNISYEFNILGQMKVLEDINYSLKNTKEEKYIKYLKKRIYAQTGFMVQYIKEHPEDKEKVIEEVKKHNLEYFPYYRLERI